MNDHEASEQTEKWDMEVKITVLFMYSSKPKKTFSLGKFGGWAPLGTLFFFLNNILIILALHGIAS